MRQPSDTNRFNSSLLLRCIISSSLKSASGYIQQLHKLIAPEVNDETLQQSIAQLDKAWSQELHEAASDGRKPSLTRTCIRQIIKSYLILAVYLVLGDLVFRSVQARQLGLLVSEVQNVRDLTTVNTHDVTIIAIVGVLAHVGTNLLTHKFMYHAFALAMRMRLACTALVHSKLTRRKDGEVMEADEAVASLRRLDRLLVHLHFLWLSPLQVALRLGLLWSHAGTSTLFALAAVILYFPLQGVVGMTITQIQHRLDVTWRSRVEAARLLLLSARACHIGGLEPIYVRLVNTLRRSEMLILTKLGALRSLNRALNVVHVRLVILSCLLGMTRIDATKVTLLLIGLGNVRFTLTQQFTLACADRGQLIKCFADIQGNVFVETASSVRYILIYEMEIWFFLKALLLRLEGEDDDEKKKKRQVEEDSRNKFGMTADLMSTLICPRHLLAIIGGPNSGKSELLMTLATTIRSRGSLSLSLSPQSGWTFPDTATNNVTLQRSSMSNTTRVSDVLKCLGIDEGDEAWCEYETRLSFARTLLADTEVYMFDEISEYDNDIKNFVYNNIINNLCNKIRIVVTNQRDILQKANVIFLMDQGRVKATGNLARLMLRHPETMSAIVNREAEKKEESPVDLQISQATTTTGNVQETVQKSFKSSSTEQKCSFPHHYKSNVDESTIVMIFFILIVLPFVASVASDVWLTIWISSEEHRQFSNQTLFWEKKGENSEFVLTFFLNHYSLSYFGSILIYFFLLFISFSIAFKLIAKSTHNLHDELILSISRRTNAYFNKKNIERIFRMLCEDVRSLDDLLPSLVTDIVEASMSVAAALILLTLFSPWLAVSGSLLLIIACCLAVTSAARLLDTRRDETKGERDLMSHVKSVTQREAIWRDCEHHLQASMRRCVLNYARSWHTLHDAHAKLALRLDLLSGVHLALVITLLWLSSNSSLLQNVGVTDATMSGMAVATCLVFVPAWERLARLLPELTLAVRRLHSLRQEATASSH